jgi:hypothetical protein
LIAIAREIEMYVSVTTRSRHARERAVDRTGISDLMSERPVERIHEAGEVAISRA